MQAHGYVWLSAALLLGGSGSGAREQGASWRERYRAAQAVPTNELARDPDGYYGRWVTVVAEVERVLGPHGFTLDEDAPLAGPDVLVLVPDPALPERAREDERVSVTGTVRRFDRVLLERDFEWFAREARDWGSALDGRAVLVAESVLTEGGRQLVAARVEPREAGTGATGLDPGGSGGDQQPALRPARPSVAVTAGELARGPEAYYGRRVSVRAEVEEVFGRRAFTLDEDRLLAGPDVLVLLRAARGDVPEDGRVTVTGIVRRYLAADLEREFDWFAPGTRWDIDYHDRPAIVADSVRTEDGRELVEPVPLPSP